MYFRNAKPVGRLGEEVTRRHREIAELVAEGLTNREIGERLGLGLATVAAAIDGLHDALDVPNRLRLAIWFLRQQP